MRRGQLAGMWWRFTVFAALVAMVAAYVWARAPVFLRSAGPAGQARPVSGRPGAAPPPAPAPEGPAAPGAAGPAGALPERDFFAEYRVDRDRARGQEREMLEKLMQGEGAEEARRQAQARYLVLGRLTALEAQLEGIIRGQGYDDAVVLLTENAAQVVLKAPALDGRQTAVLANLVRQVAGVKPTDIHITRRAP